MIKITYIYGSSCFWQDGVKCVLEIVGPEREGKRPLGLKVHFNYCKNYLDVLKCLPFPISCVSSTCFATSDF